MEIYSWKRNKIKKIRSPKNQHMKNPGFDSIKKYFPIYNSDKPDKELKKNSFILHKIHLEDKHNIQSHKTNPGKELLRELLIRPL